MDVEPQADKETIEVVTRRDWNAESPVSPIRMETPVKHVYYTETDTMECKTREQCIALVKGIQQFQMNFKGLSDIQYHFLIGGDGNIYEGRSWYTAGIDYPKHNYRIPQEMSGKCIEIAFIGCYKDKEPTNEMKTAVNSLIYYGLQNKLLEENPTENEEADTNELEQDCDSPKENSSDKNNANEDNTENQNNNNL